MENLWKTELIQPWSKSGPITGTGEWTIIDGEACTCTKPAPFYQNLADSNSGLLVNSFAPNTQYIFDFWVNGDYSINNSNGWSTGGITVSYTDGTSSTALHVTGGDGLGYQHKRLISDAGKTIYKLGIRYGYNQPVYYRWDSYIVPLTSQNVNKIGQLNTSHLIENTEEYSSFLKGGSIRCDQIYEY